MKTVVVTSSHGIYDYVDAGVWKFDLSTDDWLVVIAKMEKVQMTSPVNVQKKVG